LAATITSIVFFILKIITEGHLLFFISPRLSTAEDIPCLIIWGKEDKLIPIKYYEIFKQKLPKAKFELIADAGHAPFVEKTALFYEKVCAFLMQDDDMTKRHEFTS
jgi:pimeloyl-ACP methyl ester carboxylesterase